MRTLTILFVLLGLASAQQLQGWKLVWADEFIGPAGTPVDAKKWSFETGGWGWGNSELEFYTNSTRNASLDGYGNLAIVARAENAPNSTCWYGKCRFSSARLLTKGKFEQTYGRFEARMKLPKGQGIWPAFWMLGNNFGPVPWPGSGEIDIMENIGREPETVHGTVHGPGYSGADGITKSYVLPKGNFYEAFHVFALEWEPQEIRWYVDGNLYHTLTPNNLPKDSPWVFDHPFFLLLNLAVGGGWPGMPDETTTFPQRLVVDYVRVYGR